MRILGVDLNIALAVWWRNAALYRRTWMMNLLPNFFEPVLYLVGMGIGLGSYMRSGMEGDAYVAFIAPGLMAAAAMNGGTFETTYNMFIKQNFQRLYDAYLGTPAMMQDIVVGEIFWAVTRAAIYGLAFLLVLGVMTLFGYPIITSPYALLLPVLIALTGLTFALIGAWFTSMIRTIDLYSYFYTLFLTPLFLFSGIFFPTSTFPHGDAIAWFTPLYHAVRVARGLAQGPLTMEHLVSIVWLMVVSGVLLAIIPRRMRDRLVV